MATFQPYQQMQSILICKIISKTCEEGLKNPSFFVILSLTGEVIIYEIFSKEKTIKTNKI